eukprot:5316859-Lingulodinium_polyedra.AAC.2
MHLQGAFLHHQYWRIEDVVLRTRDASRSVRGTRDDGSERHVNVVTSHVYQKDQGEHKAGQSKGPYPWNAMVKYLTVPAKDKVVDKTPLYVNCTADDIELAMDEAEKFVLDEAKALQSLLQTAIDRKKDGVELYQFIMELGGSMPNAHLRYMPPLQTVFRSAPTDPQ